MDTIYYYHRPEMIPKPVQAEDRGGFYHPFDLVVEGWGEWKKTGVVPDPEELAKRINRRWKGDLQYFDTLIENGRPKPDPNKQD